MKQYNNMFIQPPPLMLSYPTISYTCLVTYTLLPPPLPPFNTHIIVVSLFHSHLSFNTGDAGKISMIAIQLHSKI